MKFVQKENQKLVDSTKYVIEKLGSIGFQIYSLLEIT